MILLTNSCVHVDAVAEDGDGEDEKSAIGSAAMAMAVSLMETSSTKN